MACLWPIALAMLTVEDSHILKKENSCACLEHCKSRGGGKQACFGNRLLPFRVVGWPFDYIQLYANKPASRECDHPGLASSYLFKSGEKVKAWNTPGFASKEEKQEVMEEVCIMACLIHNFLRSSSRPCRLTVINCRA